MSIISRPKKKDTAPAAPVAETGTAAPAAPVKPAKASKGPVPTLAASPRANLLPPEIGQRHAAQSARRLMRVAVVVVVLVAVAGVGGAWFLSMTAQTSLASAQAESKQLTTQQAEYSDIRQLQGEILLGTAAQEVGGSTDIDWGGYLSQLQASLPEGVALQDLTAESATIDATYQQDDGPLAGEYIATLTFTATSSTLPSIPDWLVALSGLPGFVDANPTSVTTADGLYTTTVTMHVNNDIYTNRYSAEKEADK